MKRVAVQFLQQPRNIECNRILRVHKSEQSGKWSAR